MKTIPFLNGILVVIMAASVTGVSAAVNESNNIHGLHTSGLALAVTDWEQVNSNGFGDPMTGEVTAVEPFNGYLYAGTYNQIDPAPLYDGAQIFRSSDGATWNAVTQPGFGNTHDIAPPAILDFVVFNNQIYAGTGRGNASQIWRSSNGTTWAPMDVTGFSDPDNVDITALAVYNGMIYAGVRNQVTGAQIWRSFTGDNNTWTQIAPDVPGTVPASVTGFAEFAFDGGLYAVIESGEEPAQIWRFFGGAWEVVMNDGFGDANTLFTGGMAEFLGNLYAGAGNTAMGAQLWRSSDGDIWTQAITPGFGDSNNQQVEAVYVFQNELYVSVKNAVTGMEIWRSADGTIWEQANLDGFGDSNNSGTNWSNTTSEFKSQLYVGTSNIADGGELWRTIKPNTAPTDINLSNNMVDENQPLNIVVGTLSAVDPDAGDTFTFSLACTLAGVDDGSFNILGTDLRTLAVFDFETKSSYNICVRVADQGGLTFDKYFVISVNDLVENNPPTDITLSNNTVDENKTANTVVGTLSAIDSDVGDTFTFSLECTVAGAEDGSFNILGADLRTSMVFDFETKSAYNICVRVADQGGLTLDKNFVISVNDLVENNPPTDITLSSTTVDENQPVGTVVGTLGAIDPDTGDTFTFSLACTVPSADDSSFNINGADLRTSDVFDFETKSAYNICVRVADQGGLFFDKNFVVTVNNVNETPTGIALSNNTVDENQPVNTLVGTLTATDPDAGATFTFRLACAVAGVDDSSFNISGINLRTSAVFDFETKSSYNICVRATDQGGLTFDKNFAITVNDLVENNPPTDISLSNNMVDENQPLDTVVGTLSAVDPDAGDTFTFSLACTLAGVDDGSFNILGTDLRTSAVFDFETKSSYNICVRVTDQGGLTFEKNFVISVNNVDEFANIPGKVTGGGNIDLPKGKATFGVVVQYVEGDENPSGNLTFKDHSIKLNLKASSFTLLYIDEHHAKITGYATVNGIPNVKFTLDLYDQEGPGTKYIFMIQIPDMNGYSINGVISGGSVKFMLMN